MTLYQKAWLFAGWTVLFLLVIAALPSSIGSGLITALAIIWLAHGGVALFVFVCPDCGLSLFRGRLGLLATNQPWPRRCCGACGKDHGRKA